MRFGIIPKTTSMDTYRKLRSAISCKASDTIRFEKALASSAILFE